jgi:hypothetical protein
LKNWDIFRVELTQSLFEINITTNGFVTKHIAEYRSLFEMSSSKPQLPVYTSPSFIKPQPPPPSNNNSTIIDTPWIIPVIELKFLQMIGTGTPFSLYSLYPIHYFSIHFTLVS